MIIQRRYASREVIQRRCVIIQRRSRAFLYGSAVGLYIGYGYALFSYKALVWELSRKNNSNQNIYVPTSYAVVPGTER